MFYLKYRPKTIAEVDNSRVKETMEKILSSAELPHALLFVGQKGTGKTSIARIVAKSVNCLQNIYGKQSKSFEPCNTCSNCTSIETSGSPDVIELDAASNRGIDDIRNLIKEANFLPMINRYRIFIIDEAHMITNDAFNALLKTLEEPPSSVIFILATTNEEKIPKTIASRCHIINFGKAKQTDIMHMLQKISILEKIKIDEKTLHLISQYSDRSFRDAAKILEELVIQNKLEYSEALSFLGIGKHNFLELLTQEDLKKTLDWINSFTTSNGNFKSLIEQLLEQLRQLLLQQNGIPTEEEIGLKLSLSDITLLMRLFTEAYQGLRNTPIESIPLEIAVVEFYNKRKA